VTITFVRHGKTEWNDAKRFQGQSDIPLSDAGRAQARALADSLALVPFTRAYASDLDRALATARTIARPHDVAVVPDSRLREFNFGAWEGLTWAQIVERWPELAKQPYTAARLYHPFGGESFDTVVARVRSFLDDVMQHDDEHVLVVLHAGTLHAAIEALAPSDLPAEPLAFSTASVTRVAMEAGRARLMTLNDVSHLTPTP